MSSNSTIDDKIDELKESLETSILSLISVASMIRNSNSKYNQDVLRILQDIQKEQTKCHMTLNCISQPQHIPTNANPHSERLQNESQSKDSKSAQSTLQKKNERKHDEDHSSQH